jgi:ribose-phosphate pyrophosphokinase
MLFFALQDSDMLGRRVAAAGGFELAPHEEREFDGGEHKARPLTSVRGRDVYVLHGLQGGPEFSANDRLLRMLFFLATCKENGAARVTAITPYLPYSRKERQTKPRDPVTSRYVAQLFEAAGADAVATLDVHVLAAFQNAYRCRTLHMSMRETFARDIEDRVTDHPLAIMSPDAGGVKRAQLLRETLEEVAGRDAGFAFLEKRRSEGVVSGTHFAGDVSGRSVHILDDMICGGGTIVRAARTAREQGAAEVHALATHALFTDETAEKLGEEGLLDSVTVTDSAAPFRFPVAGLGGRLRVLGAAPLIARTIRALHGDPAIEEIAPEVELLPVSDCRAGAD